MNKPKVSLVLASSSPYRRAQLEQIGAIFLCENPIFNEASAKDPSLSPISLAESLARGKAFSLQGKYPTAVILGADQLVAFDRGQGSKNQVCIGNKSEKLLGKPGSKAAAVEQLFLMAGKKHRLITSVCLITADKIFKHTDIAVLQMRDLSRKQIEAYVEADNPVDCAGSYKLESAGIGLFESIRSDDFSAIQGLPLLKLSAWFAELGLPSSKLSTF